MVDEKQVKELGKHVQADLSKMDPKIGKQFGLHEGEYKGNLQRMLILAEAGDKAGYQKLFQVLAHKVRDDYMKAQG